MSGILPWNGVITDEIPQMVTAIIQLFADEKLWKQAQQNGIAIVNTRYSKVLFVQNFIHRILSVQTNLKTHRESNFFGAILQHHTMASTKYMSKWIEEKNK